MNKTLNKTMISLEMSDVVFKQHMSSQFGLNTALITAQLVTVVMTIILSLFRNKIYLGTYSNKSYIMFLCYFK